MLLTVIVAKVSVFDDTQCGDRGKVGRVGTSYRAIWKVEGEEQKSDSLGGSAGAGEDTMDGMVLFLQISYNRSRA